MVDSEYVEEYVRKALEERPDFENVQWMLQKSSGAVVRDFSDNNHHKVIDMFLALVNNTCECSETTYLTLMDNLIADNRSNEAEDVLLKYQNSKVYNPLRKLIYQARIADVKREFEKAKEIRNTIEKEYSNNSLAMYELANIYAGKCDYINAIKMYEASFALQENNKHTNAPIYIDALHGIEICYEIMKDYNSAAKYCDKQMDVLKDYWGIDRGEAIEGIQRRKNALLNKMIDR